MAHKLTRSVILACLGTLYIFCLIQSVQAALSHTFEGVGQPLKITEEEENLLKYTKYPDLDDTPEFPVDFTGQGEHVIPEESMHIIPEESVQVTTTETGTGLTSAAKGQKEEVFPSPLTTEASPPSAESASSIFDLEIGDAEEDEGEADFGFGRVLEAKRNKAGKRLFKNKGKNVSKRQQIKGLTGKQEQQILAMHNSYRRRVPGPASNMEEMSWDAGLAKMAKKYSKQCVWEHGNPPNTTPFAHVGQNLAYGSGIKLSPMYLVTLWYREKTFYDINTDECQRNAICGHYTQIAWANTKYVGCALNYCRQLHDPNNGMDYPSALYLVCNYGPGGNIHSHFPYQIGRSCSECSSGTGKCKAGLCSDCNLEDNDCECALRCQNGGTKNSQECTCQCPPGWTGTECQNPCNNTHDWCVKYWPQEWCFKYDDVNPVEQLCPALCGVCECGGPDCANGGTKNPQTCNCDCVQPWSGPDCSECNIGCEHGVLDEAACHCKCQDGWMGESCSEPCANSHQLCYKGWYPNWCDDAHPYVPKYCQAMCGVCRVATRSMGGSGCALTCYNGGILDESACECSCQPGWYGEHCSAPCEDKFFHCAWSTSMCTSNPDFARNYCPASCGFCQVAISDDIDDNTVEIN
ncbi:uncharacterized protein [Amphiura filiformis]|uniref:uncharacterized protein n=1 Tax=Amphiura filiformis TaxID=82378 RepID=UPI003B2191EB